MGSLTDYAELELLDHVFNVAYSPVVTTYLALCTSDPTDAATDLAANECADAFAYARTAIAFDPAASRVVDQNGAVEFLQASGGGWGLVTHWAICDNAVHNGGACLAHGALGTSKTVNDGNTPSIADSDIDVTIDDSEMSDALADNLLDLMFNNTAYAVPDTFIAMIITTPVTQSMTGSTITEPAGGAYARKEVDVNAGTPPTWDVAVAGLVDNTHSIDFVTATAPWGTVIGVAICSAVTAGDLLFFDNDMADQLVDDGDTAKFPIGDLDNTLA